MRISASVFLVLVWCVQAVQTPTPSRPHCKTVAADVGDNGFVDVLAAGIIMNLVAERILRQM